MSHPLRRRIGRLLADDREARAVDVAAELGESPAAVSYHLRVLLQQEVLTVVPRRRPAPPLYRWSEQAQWARRMLREIDE